MTKKYEIHNQFTGLREEASTFEDAKVLQDNIRQEWYKSIEPLFSITVLVQNEDGTWTHSLADENGDPVPPPTE